ncbi:hypothetical protein BZL39_A02680 [Zygosaccharomyces parabailii]|nr:hypothetical protein BZL39_A02680 [Zygosaccharomyces parabailii]CDH12952.1 uncharacterized protein ZBAI_04738 [Zygosaccharomyces bailii ISA1307]
MWLIVDPLVGVQMCSCLWVSYATVRAVWSYPEEAIDTVFALTWITVQYLLGIVRYTIPSCGELSMRKRSSPKFLEKVASFDLSGDPMVWRTIAYSTKSAFSGK